MSSMVAVRPLNRSAKVGAGNKDVAAGRPTWLNLDNSRVVRDLARHASIGQFFEAQPVRFQNDTASVAQGGVVTAAQGSLTLTVSAAVLQYLFGDAVYTLGATANYAGGTQAVTPDAALPRLQAISLLTSTPATPTIQVISGTAHASATEARSLNALQSLAAAQIPDFTTANTTFLALVWVPPAFPLTTPFGVAATGVFTATAHPYRVGDPVWLSGLAGPTAGLTANTVYYVNTVPSANTFTVSATPGGPTLTWTTNVSAGTVNRQILATDIQDIRP